jgi:hypothetical protein
MTESPTKEDLTFAGRVFTLVGDKMVAERIKMIKSTPSKVKITHVRTTKIGENRCNSEYCSVLTPQKWRL